MANAMMAMITGMAISLAVAVLMERMLFRLFLKFMFSAPRLVRRMTKPQPLSVDELRKLDR